MKVPSSFQDTLLATLDRIPCLHDGHRLVVGVSGGADSCALLLSLHALRRYPLTVAYFRHHAHDREEQEACYVSVLTRAMGLPLFVGEASSVRSDHTGQSPEEVARLDRFAFFQEVCSKQGAEWIALAHTADDQVETILLHLLRGCGLEGLKGIPLYDVQRRVIHPLLAHWREETREYCRLAGLVPQQDPTNLDPTIPRNFLRLRALPLLEEVFPGSRRTIARMGETLRAENELLTDLTREESRKWVLQREEGILLLAEIRDLPVALSRRVFLEALHRWKGKAGWADVEVLQRLLTSQPGRYAVLGGGKRAERVAEGILLLLAEAEPDDRWSEFHASLTVPGRTRLPTGETVVASWVPKKDVHFARGVSFLKPEASWGEVRFWRAGDRFQPLGFPHTRKLQDFFTDRKIPVRNRHILPLLEVRGELACLIGLEVGERWRLTDQSVRALCLRREKEKQHVG